MSEELYRIKEAQLLLQNIRIGTKEQLLAEVVGMIGKGGSVATVNPIMLADAVRSEALFSALEDSVNIPDGTGVKRALAKQGIYTDTYPGVELGEALLQQGGISLGLVGAAPGVAARAMKNLTDCYRGVTPAFVFDGYSLNKEQLKAALKEKRPTLVYVCLGSPKQELLISEVKSFSPKTLFLGLGGALDIYSGKKRRAPAAFRNSGLEWLYRMLREPRRLAGLPKILDFLFLSGMEKRARNNRHN